MRNFFLSALLSLLCSPALAFFMPVRRENLVLYLPMTERQGTQLTDLSGYRSTGTLVGTAAWVIDPGGYETFAGTTSWSDLSNGGVFLPAVSGTRIEVAPDARFNFNTGDFTLVWEMSMEPVAQNGMIMQYVGGAGSGCGGRSGWFIWTQVDAGAQQINVGNCGAANNFRPATPGPNGWPDKFVHFNGVTRQGNNLVFYRDGIQTGVATMTGDFGDAGTQLLTFGEAFAPTASVEVPEKFGTICIWNVKLSSDEIRAMWERKPQRETGADQ